MTSIRNRKCRHAFVYIAVLAVFLVLSPFPFQRSLDVNSNSVLRKLSVESTFYATLEILYSKYGAEIASLRSVMRAWCEKSMSCKFTDYEAEMLYMIIRERKPRHVFEMAPDRGWSSHWILHALHANDGTSTLDSFDIHPTSLKYMEKEMRSRWNFTLGDYAVLYDEGKIDMEKYDFLFIDALHTEDFARGYCRRLLSNITRNVGVAIHDIVASPSGGGQESPEVFKYLAFANNANNVFTMSKFAMPNSLYTPRATEIIPKLNQMRADLGIVKPCGEERSCDDEQHDALYFKTPAAAPTLFFELNEKSRL